MNTDCWENHLKNFLIKTAEMYNSFLSTKHPKYAAVATLDGIYGVFQEVRIENNYHDALWIHVHVCIFCRDGILL